MSPLQSLSEDCNVGSFSVTGKQGRVVEKDVGAVAIKFPHARCQNCTCSSGFGLFDTSINPSINPSTNPSSVVWFSPDQVTNHRQLRVGQSVVVSVPAGRLRGTTAVMFGAPLLAGVGGSAIAASLGMVALMQGLMGLTGFAAGGFVSYCLREPLKRQFYDRLAITPLDS